MLAEEIKFKTVSGQKLKAQIKILQKDENFWHAFFVFLGSLSVLFAVPFYSLYIVPLLALLCGAIAYRNPAIGTILGVLLAFPAFAYQSYSLGFLFLLITAIVLFEAFEYWNIICALEVLIFLPFTPFPISFLGGFVMLGMVITALNFGSSKSILISIPSVFIILFLSSIWIYSNAAYMPINLDIYRPSVPALQFSKLPVSLNELPQEFFLAFTSLANLSKAGEFNESLSKSSENIFKLFINDGCLIQLISWSIVLYLISATSARKGKHSQFFSSLFLLFIPLTDYFISISFNLPFRIEIIFYTITSIAIIGYLEINNIKFSKENIIRKKEQLKQFGKFGVRDLSLECEEKFENIGGYEDIKEEIRDAVMLPLEQTDLAYTYGLTPPKGILLFGPPGTGKTMIIRALANEINYRLYYVNTSELLSKWYGESLPYNEKILISDAEGIRLEKIGKIVENKKEVNVLSFDSYGRVRFTNIRKFIKHKCTSPIMEIQTCTGRKIRVTDYHSLFTFDGSKIVDIKTSELVAGKSYIIIPCRIPFSDEPIEFIKFLDKLQNNDFGLYVKNVQNLINMAISKIGENAVCSELGFSIHYLHNSMKKNIGIRASKFLKLMKKAIVDFEYSSIRISAGKKSLPAKIPISEDLAFFIGLWIAEGSYNREDTVCISISEKEVEKIAKLCERLFGHVTIYLKNVSNEGKARGVYINCRPLYVFLHNILGLNDGANRKRLPNIAFSLSRKNLASLLRGYFSGDCLIYENQKEIETIEINTINKELSDQILYSLLFFGIVGTVYEKRERTNGISYRICLVSTNLSKFQEIGFFDKMKNNRLIRTTQIGNRHRYEQIPVIGTLKNTVANVLPDYINSASIGKNILFQDYNDIVDDVCDFLSSDMYMDRVQKITRVSDEKYVYDISVEPCQNFIAGIGGIFAHNSEKNVAELFADARKNAPCIIMFDEIDTIGKNRSSYTDDVTPRVMSVLLQEIDGAINSGKPIMVIGTTNIPNILDPALLRPGRFDKIIYMPLPDLKAREAIFKVYLRKYPVQNIDYEKLAKKTERFSGADIKNVIDESIKIIAKEAQKKDVIIPISNEVVLSIISRTKPSVSLAHLENYDEFKMDFERRIGVKKEQHEDEKEGIHWEDVAGLDNVKEALLETIQLPLLHEDLMKKYKVRPNKGILLFGPPGCGKTLIVRAAANELNASFILMSGAELMKKGYTQAVSVLKEAFLRAKENTPAILFIDEIETIAPSRAMGGSDIVGQLLTEMDGMKELKGVVVMGATNRPDILDSAILRPGRFDKIFYIPPPDIKGRTEIFRINLGEFASGIDLDLLAQDSEGFSGADISSVVQTAKMNALRERLTGIEPKITTQVLLKIISNRKPSITRDILGQYTEFLNEYGERR